MKQLFFSFTLALLAFVFPSCVYVDSQDDIPPRGEGTRTYDFRNFDELEMGHAFRVNVKAGSSFFVSAKGELNDLDDLNLFVENGQLIARYNNSWRNRREPMYIDITMPDIQKVDFSGAVKAKLEGFENLPALEFELSGASKVDFEGSGRDFKLDLSGASELLMFGEGKYLDGELSGASQLDAFDLITQESDLELSGASAARVCVSEFLKVDASGASNVRYKGNPNVDKKTSGGSTVRKE